MWQRLVPGWGRRSLGIGRRHSLLNWNNKTSCFYDLILACTRVYFRCLSGSPCNDRNRSTACYRCASPGSYLTLPFKAKLLRDERLCYRSVSMPMMADHNSASPSPPPQAPIASTPGPRAAALHKVFTSALSASIRANSYENFSACFPTPARHCPTALEGVWKQLNTRLEEECMRDFEKILVERQVVDGLNQWDSMVEAARRRKNRAVEGSAPDRP